MKNLKSLFRSIYKVNAYFKLILVAAFCFLMSNKGISQILPAANVPLVIYPAPSGADMANGVTVTANGQPVPVYSFPIRPETPGQGGRFCQFDFSGSVTIFVSPVPKGTLVRPAFANLNPVYTNGGVSLTLRSPVNIHIVGVVAIFANPIEVNPPRQGDPGVVYYGPGMADAGTITLSSNQTLYLAGGAYVQGLVQANGANNIKIVGRGILYRKKTGLGGYGNPGIAFDNCTNTLIEGIVHINAITHGWSGRHTESKEMKFVNLKNMGAADYSTDGHNIHNCSDVLYDNCFFICDDDNIAVKGFNFSKPCENITIQNSLLYNSNGTCITYGAESKASYYRNITVRNCDLYHDERYGGEPGKGAIAIQCRYGVRYSNLRYENITVNTSHNLINLFFTESLFAKNNGDQSTPGEIDSVWFNNITATGKGNKSIVLHGWDSTKMVKNVQFSNLVIDNKPVTSITEPYFQLNKFTENITLVDGANREEGFGRVIDLKSQWNNQIPLENPHKGWYHHFPDNGLHHYVIANDSDLTKFPGMDHLYIRLAWSYLEPGEGQFNWDIIDQMIEKWTTYNMGISFRISCMESTINRIEQQFATPKWVMEAGAKGRFTSLEKPNAPWEPVFDDPIFLAKLENFLKVFAQRYDGKSWLRYVDIGSIGPWGEGHSKVPYNYEQRKVHVDLHLKYFKKSLLCISDDFVYSIKDTTERKMMHQYIVENGITYRDDSPLVKGYLSNHAKTYTVRSPEFFEDVYRSKPTVFELQHYGSVKNEGNWTATPGSLLAQYAPGKTGPDFFRGSLDLLHATYIGYHGDAHEWLTDNPKLSNELLNQCGYWYFPHSVEIPQTIKGGEEITIAIVWENRGVAPAYNPYDLVLRLKGADSVTINLPSGNEQWLPSKEKGTYRKEYRMRIPTLAAGEYDLALKLYSPQEDRTVYLGLNPAIMDQENFYRVGKVKVKAMAAPAQKTVAPTPPMGWNSWNTFQQNINEQLFKETADVLISSGLADVGYVYVDIDGGWCGEEANEAIKEKFPNGIAYLADYMHQRNLKLGLYTHWRSIGKEERDAKQWAEWKIDLIKNDAYKTPSTDPYWTKMQAALLATGRPIVHSIHFSDEDSNPSNICEISNMWRITNDIKDYYNHESLPDDKKSWAFSTLDIIDRMAEVSHMIKPGCWADPDMLEIGNGNQTVDEYKTQFTMWCLLPAPLIMGNDIRTMNDETKAILMNKEAIAVNQDPAVIPAKRVRKDANTELWSRTLADGSLCVVVLQKTKKKQKVEFTWEEIGLTAAQPASVRDLWQHKTVGVFTKRFSIAVNAQGCAMLKITQNK